MNWPCLFDTFGMPSSETQRSLTCLSLGTGSKAPDKDKDQGKMSYLPCGSYESYESCESCESYESYESWPCHRQSFSTLHFQSGADPLQDVSSGMLTVRCGCKSIRYCPTGWFAPGPDLSPGLWLPGSDPGGNAWDRATLGSDQTQPQHPRLRSRTCITQSLRGLLTNSMTEDKPFCCVRPPFGMGNPSQAIIRWWTCWSANKGG